MRTQARLGLLTTFSFILCILLTACATADDSSRDHIPRQAPIQSREAGFLSVAFSDDFDDLTTIDVASSGQNGFKWYVDMPFGWPDPHASFEISDSVLSLHSKAGTYNNGNWSMATKSPGSRAGRAFKYGYFEARLRFDEQPGPQSGWPAFWSIAESRVVTRSDARYGELDFFETTGNGRLYSGTVHDFRTPKTTEGWKSLQNDKSNVIRGSYDFAQWNNFGCLWEPNRVRWYLNDTLMIDQRYGPQGPPIPNPEAHPKGTYSVLDEDSVIVILGTGEGWPLEVDYVKVWR